MTKFLCLLCIITVLVSCSGTKLVTYCDKAQAQYLRANAAAVALKPTISYATWNDCVVPLDHVTNDAVVACYRAAASGSLADAVQAMAASASALALDYAVLKGCQP